MHYHTPSRHKNIILQYLGFFLSPMELYCYCSDGVGICSQCDTPIAVPSFYNSPITLLVYFFNGFLGVTLGALLPPFKGAFLLVILLVIVGHQAFTAFVFCVGKWIPYEPSTGKNLVYKHTAKKKLLQKAYFCGVGMIFRCILSLCL